MLLNSGGDFNTLLPHFISARLRDGFMEFDGSRRDFSPTRRFLIGLESRTLSPVRITRDSVTLQSTGVAGLFPAGEEPDMQGE